MFRFGDLTDLWMQSDRLGVLGEPRHSDRHGESSLTTRTGLTRVCIALKLNREELFFRVSECGLTGMWDVV